MTMSSTATSTSPTAFKANSMSPEVSATSPATSSSSSSSLTNNGPVVKMDESISPTSQGDFMVPPAAAGVSGGDLNDAIMSTGRSNSASSTTSNNSISLSPPPTSAANMMIPPNGSSSPTFSGVGDLGGGGGESNPGSTSSGNSREPDADSIKMFVGQIPRDWDETQCKTLFSTYGDIYSLNVLRDKTTQVSRGCCFVTYYTRKAALDAQNDLHNIRTLDGMHHPIQMKPADSENRNERKLFVGMLAKKYSENDVRLMFAAYGNIEECTVLRDATGVSKGCAFVTFATRQCAVNAIKHMNHSQTMEGCSSPIVVKFADTQKDKDARRQQQILMQQLAAVTTQPPAAAASAATLAAAATNPAYLAAFAAAANVAQQQHHQQQQVVQAQAAQQQAVQQQQQLAAATLAMQQHMAASGADPLSLAAQIAALASNPMMLASLCGIGGAAANSHVSGSTGASTPSTASHLNGGSDMYGPPPTGPPNQSANGHHHPQPTGPGGSYGGPLTAFTASQAASLALAVAGQQGQPGHNPHSQGIHGGHPSHHPSALHPQGPHHPGHPHSNLHSGAGGSSVSPLSGHLHHPHSGSNGGPNGGNKQMEGPEGANLFIYHLPAEFTDGDLAAAFGPFGHVLSSKVFIDKQTNLSKCFGFVSYDNPMSAQAAIQSMNGFQINTKRLKVQLKRSKDKPY